MNERTLIISGFSQEELWMFHAIGGVVPYGAQRRLELRSRQARMIDGVTRGEMKAGDIGAERTASCPAESSERKVGAA